jgi:DNA-binding transcriptional ArsR family regulator
MKRIEFLNKVNRAFELLGNPLRLKIYMRILAEGCDCDFKTQKGETGNCVSGLMKDLSMPQSTISTYIKELADGDLIECRKKGKYLYCRPNKKTLIAIKSFIDGSLSQIIY